MGQIPIAIACCILTASGLQEFLQAHHEEGHDNTEELETELKPTLLSFDIPGAITFAVAITSLLTIIDLQRQLSWQHPLVLGITLIGIFFLIAFTALESFPGSREVLIPLRLLKTEAGAFYAGQVSGEYVTSDS